MCTVLAGSWLAQPAIQSDNTDSDTIDSDVIGSRRIASEPILTLRGCLAAVIYAKKLDKIETFGKSMALHYCDRADTAVVNMAEL